MAVERARDELPKVLNGVDTEAVARAVAALAERPELAAFRFRLKNKWIDCGHNRSTISDFHGTGQDIPHLETFKLDSDEPPTLAGKDLGANPVEHLLNALAACLTTTMVYHAALRGIRIEALESELEGDIDLLGFLAISDDVRRGYQNIRVKFRVKTDAPNLARLKALSKLSPVMDVVSKGTNVEVEVEKM